MKKLKLSFRYFIINSKELILNSTISLELILKNENIETVNLEEEIIREFI